MIPLVTFLACVLLLLVGPSPAPAQPPPVKLGTLLPHTGPLSVQGTDATKGDLGDRGQTREALRVAPPTIKAPRGGPLQFDAHRQVITPRCVMRTDRQGNRIVNGIVERIPPISQEATWT